jgi:hypothetical protein
MDALGADSAKIEFTPAPDWSWKGWDGTVELTAGNKQFASSGNAVALAADIQMLGPKLVGKMYTAAGFEAIPGSCVMANIVVNQATLSKSVSINGQRCVTAQTRGTFTLGCVPSFGSAATPPPDPNPVKTGTWKFTQLGQHVSATDS